MNAVILNPNLETIEKLYPEIVEAATKPQFNVNDGVSWGSGTDVRVGTVVRVVRKTVYVVEDEAQLVGEIHMEPGGFCGHATGKQEYTYTRGKGKPLAFTFRNTGDYKLAGTSIHGSMSNWGILSHGRHKFYDYNF